MMSQAFFDEMAIPRPVVNLAVGSGAHGAMLGAMLARLEQEILTRRPDWVLVYGDTNSTLAGALAFFINEITNNEAPIAYLPGRDWDHAGHRFGSTEKAQRELDFQAQIALREGLSKTVEWTQKHLSLIQQCMDRHRSHMSW